MKEIMALAVFLAVAIPTIILAIKKKINTSLTSALLIFSIFAGLATANYNVIKYIKYGNIELQTYKEDVDAYKQSALNEIQSQIEDQKGSLKILIRDLNAQSEKLENQNTSLNNLISVAEALHEKTETQKKEIEALNSEAKNTKEEIEKLTDASDEIALILVRATYYTLETKNEFGGNRVKIAMQEILNDLNTILPRVIPDPQERARWIRELKEKLPGKK